MFEELHTFSGITRLYKVVLGHCDNNPNHLEKPVSVASSGVINDFNTVHRLAMLRVGSKSEEVDVS